MLILIEGIVLCFILLIFCVIGIANGPEKFTVFYEKDVQDKAIELGYTTKKDIKKQAVAFFCYSPYIMRFLLSSLCAD